MMDTLLIISNSDRFEKDMVARLSRFGYGFRRVKNVEELLEIEEGFQPALALVEVGLDTHEVIDALHSLQVQMPNAKALVLYTLESLMEVRELHQNGAWQVLQRPFDDALIVSMTMEAAPILIPEEKLTLECLSPVRIGDMKPHEKFGFDLFLFLPINNRILLYRRKNSDLTDQELERFKKKNLVNLYIRKTESPAFRQHVANQLSATYKDPVLSETERSENLQREVRELLAPVFDSSELDAVRSMQILERSKNVVAQFILEVSPHPEIFQHILALSAQSFSNYRHAVNVSTYSTLFALALGYKEIEAVAIGGLLHDIGLASLPEEVAGLMPENMEPSQAEIYKRHVQSGLDLLQNKKIPAAETVISVIRQHHEHIDGSGYPKGITGELIHPLAKVCAIADEFDQLTSVRPQRTVMSPAAALDHMVQKNAGVMRFDPELLLRLREHLMPQTETARSIDLNQLQLMVDAPVVVMETRDESFEDTVAQPVLGTEELAAELDAIAPSENPSAQVPDKQKILENDEVEDLLADEEEIEDAA